MTLVCGVCFVAFFTYTPGGGTPYMMGDTYVPRFWPPFLTLWVPNSIFLGCFFSSTNTKTIFWVQILTKLDLFGPKIPFSPRSFWVQFSVAHGTPPAIFGPSTPPPPPPPRAYTIITLYWSDAWETRAWVYSDSCILFRPQWVDIPRMQFDLVLCEM